MQSIKTKYFGPGNVRSARMQARCAAASIFVHYLHELNHDENHRNACEKLREKLGWTQSKGYAPMRGGTDYEGAWHWVNGTDLQTTN